MEIELIKAIVSEVMKVDVKELNNNTTFIEDLGADSLDVCRILMGIEEQFSVKLEKENIYKINTIEDTVTLIRKIKKA